MSEPGHNYIEKKRLWQTEQREHLTGTCRTESTLERHRSRGNSLQKT